MRALLALLLLFSLPAVAADVRNNSGLPIPRFVTLKAEEVNLRSGPGTRYPIQWVYRRAGWPVEVVEEFDTWRKIRDADGASGWVHRMMLDGRRNALTRGKKSIVMYDDPSEEAGPLVKLSPGVVVSLRQCKRVWCQARVQDRKGWIKKSALWGVYDSEEFD